MITREGIKFRNISISWILISGFIICLALFCVVYPLIAKVNKEKDSSISSEKSTLDTGTGQGGETNLNKISQKSTNKSSKSTFSTSSNGTTPTNQSGNSEEQAATLNLVALGDSITNAANPNSSMIGDNPSYSFSTGTNISSIYLFLTNRGEKINPLKLAVSGAKSSDCLAAQVPQVSGYNPKYISLLIGGNDLLNWKTPAEFQSNLQAIGAGIKKDGRTVLIATIPNYYIMKQAPIPACQNNPLSEQELALLNWALGQYNSAIASVANANGFTLVDLYPYLDQNDISDYDCIHPNLSGLQKIANRFIAAL